MKQLLFLISALLSINAIGQGSRITTSNLAELKNIELKIAASGRNVIESEEMTDRFRADSAFTRGLVQALKTPFSFDYTFDSLTTISKIVAPDNSFKIFTWQVMKDLTYFRQRGCIQMNTADGSLKIFPLFDYSEFAENPVDSTRANNTWIGAIYYNIILKTFNKKNYYTLLGFDDNDARSTKKWIEVLTFDDTGLPRFGGRFFNYPTDSVKPPQPAYRFCLEYKKDGRAKMNYDPAVDMIIFARLTSETGDYNNKYELVPYGDFEGFQWKNGKWVHVKNPYANTIFNEKQSSLSNPLYDDEEKSEKKLSEISKKNMKKKGGGN